MSKPKTQIYSATYSSVPVYEFILGKASVMRRKSDGWINATHILKVAEFPKAKRTRILEKDVQIGVHEKVQGGYGKYQGTWVPLERARELAKQFEVDKTLAPILEFTAVDGQPSPPPAPKHTNAPRVARSTSVIEPPTSGRSTPINAKKMASMPADAASKRRGRPPKLKVDSTLRFSGIPITRTPDSFKFSGNIVDSSPPSDIKADIEEAQSPTESSPSDFMSDTDLAVALQSPSGKVQTQRQKWFENGNQDYKTRLVEYFLHSDNSDDELKIPEFLFSPPPGYNVNEPIDNEGHTAFHWACSMGDLRIADALLSCGSNTRSLNVLGQVPIMRSVLFTNTYNKRTLPRFLDLCRDTLLDTDKEGRNILHLICLSTDSHVKLDAERYYMELLLAKVSETQPKERLNNFINQQDDKGNTPLHIVSITGAKRCIRILLSHGADSNIPNNDGETARSLIQRSQLFKANGKLTDSMDAEQGLPEPIVERMAKQLMESFSELAKAYDNESNSIDEDYTQVQNLLQETIRENNSHKETLSGVMKNLAEFPQGKQITDIESVRQSEEETDLRYKAAANSLRRILERSQAKRLADVVRQKETDAVSDLAEEGESVASDLVEISVLQINRKKLLNNIISLCAESSGESDKMRKYRKLVSICCEVDIDSVDGLIDGILQVLAGG